MGGLGSTPGLGRKGSTPGEGNSGEEGAWWIEMRGKVVRELTSVLRAEWTGTLVLPVL